MGSDSEAVIFGDPRWNVDGNLVEFTVEVRSDIWHVEIHCCVKIFYQGDDFEAGIGLYEPERSKALEHIYERVKHDILPRIMEMFQSKEVTFLEGMRMNKPEFDFTASKPFPPFTYETNLAFERPRNHQLATIAEESTQKLHASHEKLTELKDELNGLRGHDKPIAEGSDNTVQVPLSQESLDLLRGVVDATINLHRVPTFPERIRNALGELIKFLEQTKEVIDKLAENVSSLSGLAVKLGAACLALKELADLLGITLG